MLCSDRLKDLYWSIICIDKVIFCIDLPKFSNLAVNSNNNIIDVSEQFDSKLIIKMLRREKKIDNVYEMIKCLKYFQFSNTYIICYLIEILNGDIDLNFLYHYYQKIYLYKPLDKIKPFNINIDNYDNFVSRLDDIFKNYYKVIELYNKLKTFVFTNLDNKKLTLNYFVTPHGEYSTLNKIARNYLIQKYDCSETMWPITKKQIENDHHFNKLEISFSLPL